MTELWRLFAAGVALCRVTPAHLVQFSASGVGAHSDGERSQGKLARVLLSCYFMNSLNSLKSRFRDRRHAGQVLAQKLEAYAHKDDTLVLGLPRGGVPVAFEVARALRAVLDVFLVRKLGVPGHEELAMGAIAAGGTRLINWEVVEGLRVSQPALDAVIHKEERALERRERLYRGSSPRASVADRVVVLVDDGLATGSTMRVALTALREQHPARIVVGVPIAPSSTCEELADLADEVHCSVTLEPFYSVSLWYEDFSQTTDHEVRELLVLAAHERAEQQGARAQAPSS